MRPERRDLWSVILAGGAGARFAPLARSLGTRLPKQFVAVLGERTMVQETVARFAMLVPPSRIVVVTQARYASTARAQLKAWPGAHLLAQPSDRGTAPALLLALAHVRARAPDAHVVMTPSDHHVPRPGPLLEAVAVASGQAGRVPVTLLGVPAECPETRYGWVVPGRSLGGAFRAVARFVEKPSLPVASHLYARRALWNTMVTVGTTSGIWDLVAGRLPKQAAAIAAHVRAAVGPAHLEACYLPLEAADIGGDVMDGERELSVLCVKESGWRDLGWPEQVFDALRGEPELDVLRARLSRRSRHAVR